MRAAASLQRVYRCCSVCPDGRAAHLNDVVEIRARNQIPLLTFTIADVETMVASTAGVPRPVLH